jgi:hypothetical protein
MVAEWEEEARIRKQESRIWKQERGSQKLPPSDLRLLDSGFRPCWLPPAGGQQHLVRSLPISARSENA